jgi:hypothetical protein
MLKCFLILTSKKDGGFMRYFFLFAAVFFFMSSLSPAENLLGNGGFEQWTGGIPDGWSLDDSITVAQNSDTTYSGNYSARFYFTTQDQSDTDVISDPVTVTGDTIQLWAWVYDNDPAGRMSIYISWDTGNVYSNKYSSDLDSWQQVSYTMAKPEGATTARMVLRFYDVKSEWDGDCLIYVDEVFCGYPTSVKESTWGQIKYQYK